MKSNEANTTSADIAQAIERPSVAQNPRREHTLKLPITQGNVDKVAGDKVNLNDRQADALRTSGHIA